MAFNQSEYGYVFSCESYQDSILCQGENVLVNNHQTIDYKRQYL